MPTVEMTPETLFENNRGLVYWYARRLFWRNLMDKDDLIQEAEIALWRASCHFNPEFGFKFSSFAVKYIRTAIWKAIHREWKQKRNMLQGSSNEPDAGMTVERIAVSRNVPAEEQLMRTDELEKFRQILPTIDGAAGETLRRRAAGQTLQEIGEASGVSRELVRQKLIVFHDVARKLMEGQGQRAH